MALHHITPKAPMNDELRDAGRPTTAAHDLPDLAAPDVFDPVIEVYKKDVDRTLLRENLKLTVEDRLRKLVDFTRFLDEMRRAGRTLRERESKDGNAIRSDPSTDGAARH
jgi:hypothetical protein